MASPPNLILTTLPALAAIILIDHPRFGRKGTAVLLYCLSAPNIFWFCNSGHLFNAFFARVTLFGGEVERR